MNNYYMIEIEATNFCNAKCVFCANQIIDRKRGFMSVELFKSFIEYQKNYVFKMSLKE